MHFLIAILTVLKCYLGMKSSSGRVVTHFVKINNKDSVKKGLSFSLVS